MTAHTKLSAKGQVVIPKALRERLCWMEGDELEVIETVNGLLLTRRASERPRITIREFLEERPAYTGRPATIEKMDEAVERALAERWSAKEARSR